MENTNKTVLKKYIKLEDGRVIESSKLKDSYSWKDYSDIKLVKEDNVYDYNSLDKSKRYVEEIIPSCTIFESDDSKFTEIIATSDYLYAFHHKNELELEVVIKQPNGKYNFVVGFNPDNELYVTEKWIPMLLGSDQEVLLGSWYEGGMRFVAKWDREKKEWVLI